MGAGSKLDDLLSAHGLKQIVFVLRMLIPIIVWYIWICVAKTLGWAVEAVV